MAQIDSIPIGYLGVTHYTGNRFLFLPSYSTSNKTLLNMSSHYNAYRSLFPRPADQALLSPPPPPKRRTLKRKRTSNACAPCRARKTKVNLKAPCHRLIPNNTPSAMQSSLHVESARRGAPNVSMNSHLLSADTTTCKRKPITLKIRTQYFKDSYKHYDLALRPTLR